MLPENYIVRITSEDQWYKVLKVINKEKFEPTKGESYHNDISVQNGKYDGWNRSNRWYRNKISYKNFKFLTFQQWEIII